jgi:hypothetical protein
LQASKRGDGEHEGASIFNYSRGLMEPFVNKLCASPGVTAAILLTHNGTDSAWFETAIKHCAALCFARGRLEFYNEKTVTGGWIPPSGHIFYYFGREVDRFCRKFEQFGVCLPKHEVQQLAFSFSDRQIQKSGRDLPSKMLAEAVHSH